MPSLGPQKDDSYILIADPDRSRAERLLALARDQAATVLRASTCEQAQTALFSGHAVDLVVTAVSFPDGNWDCVFRSLVENNESASVVVVAAQESAHLRDEVAGRGASGLLVEPFDAAEAGALLRESWRLGLAARSRKLP